MNDGDDKRPATGEESSERTEPTDSSATGDTARNSAPQPGSGSSDPLYNPTEAQDAVETISGAFDVVPLDQWSPTRSTIDSEIPDLVGGLSDAFDLVRADSEADPLDEASDTQPVAAPPESISASEGSADASEVAESGTQEEEPVEEAHKADEAEPEEDEPADESAEPESQEEKRSAVDVAPAVQTRDDSDAEPTDDADVEHQSKAVETRPAAAPAEHRSQHLVAIVVLLILVIGVVFVATNQRSDEPTTPEVDMWVDPGPGDILEPPHERDVAQTPEVVPEEVAAEEVDVATEQLAEVVTNDAVDAGSQEQAFPDVLTEAVPGPAHAVEPDDAGSSTNEESENTDVTGAAVDVQAVEAQTQDAQLELVPSRDAAVEVVIAPDTEQPDSQPEQPDSQPEPEPEPSGLLQTVRLNLDSTPGYVRVYHEGELLDRTPIDQDIEVAADFLEVELRKTGFAPLRVRVPAGAEPCLVHVALQPPGEVNLVEVGALERTHVEVTSIPNRARVYIDEDFVGRTPLEVAYCGGEAELELMVRKTGFLTFRQQIETGSGVTPVSAELIPE